MVFEAKAPSSQAGSQKKDTPESVRTDAESLGIPEHQLAYCQLDLARRFPEVLERDCPIVIPETVGIVDVRGFTSWATAEGPIPRRGGQMYAAYLNVLGVVFDEHEITLAGVRGDEASGVGKRMTFTKSVRFALRAQQEFLNTAREFPDVKKVIEREKEAGVHVGINFPTQNDPEPLLLRRVNLGNKSEIAVLGPKTSVKRLKHPLGVVVTATESRSSDTSQLENDTPDVVVAGLATPRQIALLQDAGLVVHSYNDPLYSEHLYKPSRVPRH